MLQVFIKLQNFNLLKNFENNFSGTLQSVQQMELNESQTDQEINCTTPKIEGTSSHSDYSAAEKSTNESQVASPTQPKTLQQEFSLINMNIPNIEVSAMSVFE